MDLSTLLVRIYSIIPHYPTIFKALSLHYIFLSFGGMEDRDLVSKCVVVCLVMLITTILLTLVMLLIWRTHVLLASLFSVFVLEGIYVSAVSLNLLKADEFLFPTSFTLAFIMFGWFYGRQRKIEYEITHKITFERLEEHLEDCIVQRVPGLCFFYTNIQDGLTPILGHYIKNMRSLHKVTIFTTLRYLIKNMRGLSSKNRISKGYIVV